jgi:formylmethanofuran dehydrogenase subunit B
MTLEQAIEILQNHKQMIIVAFNHDLNNAVQLGIEAIKRLIEYRQWHRSTSDGPLPGETEQPDEH